MKRETWRNIERETWREDHKERKMEKQGEGHEKEKEHEVNLRNMKSAIITCNPHVLR